MCHFPLHEFNSLDTPFYYYDMGVLRKTIDAIKNEIKGFPFVVHYAIKANGNPVILKEIAGCGLGVDVVSGNEIDAAVAAGFNANNIVFSGVGKTDREIETALKHNIYTLNVESIQEMEIINSIAQRNNKVVGIAIRVNPNIDAHTHHYITTGTSGDKFGISIDMLPEVVEMASQMPGLHLIGLHFHIGSQITHMRPYEMLCDKVNGLLDEFEQRGITFEILNLGGGLGVDYDNPDESGIAHLSDYFNVFKRNLKLRKGQTVHFELGRAIVAQCGSLISRVVFVKESWNKKFVILDAGMTTLIRPALYQAHHKIQNLTSQSQDFETYDVVGPVCESSDVFGHDEKLPITCRGDIFAIRSAGAYGESMASCYNMRPLPLSHFGD